MTAASARQGLASTSQAGPAGAADGQTSALGAPDRVRLFRPVPMCETAAQSQRRKGAARPRYTARHGAKHNDAYPALHGVPDAISRSQVRSYAVPDVERAGARGTATAARRAPERATAAAEEPALGVRLR